MSDVWILIEGLLLRRTGLCGPVRPLAPRWRRVRRHGAAASIRLPPARHAGAPRLPQDRTRRTPRPARTTGILWEPPPPAWPEATRSQATTTPIHEPPRPYGAPPTRSPLTGRAYARTGLRRMPPDAPFVAGLPSVTPPRALQPRDAIDHPAAVARFDRDLTPFGELERAVGSPPRDLVDDPGRRRHPTLDVLRAVIGEHGGPAPAHVRPPAPIAHTVDVRQSGADAVVVRVVRRMHLRDGLTGERPHLHERARRELRRHG